MSMQEIISTIDAACNGCNVAFDEAIKIGEGISSYLGMGLIYMKQGNEVTEPEIILYDEERFGYHLESLPVPILDQICTKVINQLY